MNRWIIAVTCVVSICQVSSTLASTLDSLTIEEFKMLVQHFSEENGYFESDNFVSNELSYLSPLPVLKRLDVQGGVYVGVGPAVNLTYIAHVQPDIAFIVDIRRGNLLQHMMFKALFSFSKTRKEFLSFLFSKPLLQADVSNEDIIESELSIVDLVAFFEKTDSDSVFFNKNLNRLKKECAKYGITDTADLESLVHIYRAFYTHHLNIRYETVFPLGDPAYPSFKDLLLTLSPDGMHGHFLNSKQHFDYVKEMQRRNLVLPIVGNFAGPTTFKRIGQYLKRKKQTVAVFYTSNVEAYLTDDYYEVFGWYVDNIRQLPITKSSIIIRGYVGSFTPHPKWRHTRYATTVHFLARFVEQYDRGRFERYGPSWITLWPLRLLYYQGGRHSYVRLLLDGIIENEMDY